MTVRTRREVPLVVLGVSEPGAWQVVADALRQEGMAVALALGERGCLRVATAVQPDVVLLDPRLPRGLLSLLRAHPLAKTAQISWSQALGVSTTARRKPTGVVSTSLTD